MLQDAGLSLDDIEGILGAARRRGLEADRHSTGSQLLDAEIERLQHARDYLAGSVALPLRSSRYGVPRHGRRDRPPPHDRMNGHDGQRARVQTVIVYRCGTQSRFGSVACAVALIRQVP